MAALAAFAAAPFARGKTEEGWGSGSLGPNDYQDPEVMRERLEWMRDVLKIQGRTGNWDYDRYMHGMYNGMELMQALIEGREPDYRDAPEEWLSKYRTEHCPASHTTELLS